MFMRDDAEKVPQVSRNFQIRKPTAKKKSR